VNRTQLIPPRATASRPAPGGVQIRAATARDGEAMLRFVAGLSPGTQFLRFFTAVPRPSSGLLSRLCGAGEMSDVLVATDDGVIVGHAMAADSTGTDGGRVADIGVVVADQWQHRGIGAAMLRDLIGRAAGRGVSELVMDVRPENRTMLAMIGRRWASARYQAAADAITVRVRLSG
jgi:ribosomal protein S18 acetylase RimI-like enzyme